MRRALIRLYPRATRERYGAEILELLHESPKPLRDAADVGWHALTERIEHIMTVAYRRYAASLALFAVLAVGFALTQHALIWFGNVYQDSATGSGPARLGTGGVLLAQAPMFLVLMGLLAGAVRWGRRGRWSPDALGVVLTAAAGLAVGDLLLMAIRGPVDGERVRMALVAPVVWGAGMALLVVAYRAMRRREVRFAGIVAAAGAVVLHLIVFSAPVITAGTHGQTLRGMASVSAGSYWDQLTTLPLYGDAGSHVALVDVRQWLLILAAGFCFGLLWGPSAAARPVPSAAVDPVAAITAGRMG
ncbi:hypothetical protein AB0M47_32195 [Hamadaea sp. NPDC051192]|uniref:hypothetical protein n=1 Tax=Hamadaea sp. NPDC051192 TaxID=3154940 RepID=UPI00343A61F2